MFGVFVSHLLCRVPESLDFFSFFYFHVSVCHVRCLSWHLPILSCSYWHKSGVLKSWEKLYGRRWALVPGEPHCGVLGRGSQFVGWPSNIGVSPSILLPQSDSPERSPQLSYLESISLVTSVVGRELSLALGRDSALDACTFTEFFCFQPLASPSPISPNLVFLSPCLLWELQEVNQLSPANSKMHSEQLTQKDNF